MKRQTNGHRWTNEELSSLIRMWGDKLPVHEIAQTLGVTESALDKQIVRMRNAGVPLYYRGRPTGKVRHGDSMTRAGKLWSQSECEYLMRRRADKATAAQIASEMNRSEKAINGMIGSLRSQGVPVQMLGTGVHKLWNPDLLRALAVDRTNPTSAEAIGEDVRSGVDVQLRVN